VFWLLNTLYDFVAHLASHLMGTDSFFPRGKLANAWVKYVLHLTQLFVYSVIIIILLLATSFGFKMLSSGQYLQKTAIDENCFP
jgi:hypothetical protein